MDDEKNVANLLNLPLIVIRNPELIAQAVDNTYDYDPICYHMLSEMLKVIIGQDTMKYIKRKQQFTLEQQTVLYEFFIKNQDLNDQLLNYLSNIVQIPEKEIRNWWYNRRSDIKDKSFKLPPNVRVQLQIKQMKAQKAENQ